MCLEMSWQLIFATCDYARTFLFYYPLYSTTNLQSLWILFKTPCIYIATRDTQSLAQELDQVLARHCQDTQSDTLLLLLQ